MTHELISCQLRRDMACLSRKAHLLHQERARIQQARATRQALREAEAEKRKREAREAAQRKVEAEALVLKAKEMMREREKQKALERQLEEERKRRQEAEAEALRKAKLRKREQELAERQRRRELEKLRRETEERYQRKLEKERRREAKLKRELERTKREKLKVGNFVFSRCCSSEIFRYQASKAGSVKYFVRFQKKAKRVKALAEEIGFSFADKAAALKRLLARNRRAFRKLKSKIARCENDACVQVSEMQKKWKRKKKKYIFSVSLQGAQTKIEALIKSFSSRLKQTEKEVKEHKKRSRADQIKKV